jgi:arylsulfatase A-like enzyme
VAVTSDHGEYLGERGLVDHSVLLYPEVLHVPLVISAPGRLPEGVVVDTAVELQDLHATLLELALDAREEGSLLPMVSGGPGKPLLRAEARPRGDARSQRMKRHHRLCRWGDAAVIVSEGGPAEHYDLGTDPRMERNLAGERPERTAELAQRCRGSFGDAVGAGSRPEPGTAPGSG